MAVLEYDAIVDAKRQGDFETIQAADDALDGGAYMVYVKKGVYAGFTVSTNNVWIFCEPGTVITSAVTLSGAGVCLQMGAGSDIQALTTLSGIGNSFICENGVDGVGIVVSAASCLVEGGGWDTLMDGGITRIGISVTDTDCIVENIACQTTSGGGQLFTGLTITGARATVSKMKIVDSDHIGLAAAGGADCLIEGCVILGADLFGLQVSGLRNRIIGNYALAAGDDGISIDANGDDTIVLGNVVQDQANQSVNIDTNGENCVVVGNRTDGAVSDNSGTSTVALNDETAF